MEIKNNKKIIIIFSIICALFCVLFGSTYAHAETIDDKEFSEGMMSALDEIYAPESCIIYNNQEDKYYLITYSENQNPIFGYYQDKKTIFFQNTNWESGSYTYDAENQKWIQTSNLISQYTYDDNSYILYTTQDVIDEEGEVYYYSTKSIITVPYLHCLNTSFYQSFMKNLKTILPFAIVGFGLIFGVKLVPKIFKKFVK